MSQDEATYPVITVITVCFNAAAFIEQTIQSVLSQSYPHIEYVIIDGGSTDGTVEIISQYSDHLAYWHSKADRGLAHAFNLGLGQARGNWIIFLNADDFFLNSTVIDEMVPHLRRHEDADVVFGETIITVCQQNARPSPFRKIFGQPWSWQAFRRFCIIPHPSAFTNRRYFKLVGVFDESFRTAMDYELYLRGGEKLRAHYVPVLVSGMRDGGISQKNIVRSMKEGLRAQLLTRALPKCSAWLNFYWQIGRCFLGKLAHLVLDPLAPYITLRHRNSGGRPKILS